MCLVAWGYSFLGSAFQMVPVDYQWTIALVCPIVREIYVWGILEISYRAAGAKYRDAYDVTFPASHYMESKQSVFYCVTLASVTPLTVYVIIATDFSMNIWHGYTIIRDYKKAVQVHPEGAPPIDMENHIGTYCQYFQTVMIDISTNNDVNHFQRSKD